VSMRKLLLFSCIFLASGCKGKSQKDPWQKDQTIADKAALYISLQKSWAHGCDGVGFEALCKLAGGCKGSDIFQAEGEPGRWYRTPAKTCFDNGESKSDISKDMFVMLFPYLYATGNQDALSRIHEYGRSHNWIMGRGPLSRTFLSPPLALFLGEMLRREVVIDNQEETATEKAGYEKHLDVIFWMTQAMVRGHMQATDYELLRKYAEDQPRNALVQALRSKYQDGDQAKAIAILKDETLFPSTRLPTSLDRCEIYLWQRDDEPKDWGPCDAGRTHDGTDFILAAWVAGQI
jgi:hypothetical protein